MADLDKKETPECFARLEKVFPMGLDGLRHTPPECLDCDLKTECLRAAVTGVQGVVVHEERLKRASQAGSVGFLERWARKKTLAGLKPKGGDRPGLWKRLRRVRRSEPPDEG